MSDELCYDFTAYGLAVKHINEQLTALVVPTPAQEPAVPQLLSEIVYRLTSDNESEDSGPVWGYPEMIKRLLQGAAAKSITSGVFDAVTASRICEIRAQMLATPLSDTEQPPGQNAVPVSKEYTALYLELTEILSNTAQQLAAAVRGCREQNATERNAYEARNTDLEREFAQYWRLLQLAATRLARRVLLGELSVLDVIKANKKADAWSTFRRALIAESQWIAAEGKIAELAIARSVVQSFASEKSRTAAKSADVDIKEPHSVCLGWLGSDSLASGLA